MRGWIDLPVEIRHKCINRMSILSSMSLRQCSKNDQQVVDSMHLNIPRIRIAEKRERVLIVVYTGVQTFLRMEFRKGDKHNETVMFRSENTIKNPKIKKIPNKMPKDMIYTVLKSICGGNRKKKIGTIEWEIEGEKEEEWEEEEEGKPQYQYDLLSNLGITPRRLGPNTPRSFFLVEGAIKTTLMAKVYSTGELSIRDPIPTEIYNLKIFKQDIVLMSFGSYYMHNENCVEIIKPLYVINGMPGLFKGSVSFPLIKDVQLKVVRQILNKIDEKKVDGVLVERFEFCDDREAIVCSSPCGVWAQLVEIGQNHFKLDNFSCGMGIGCKIHEPFEYWYHSQLPRRLVDEPFWSGNVEQEDKNFNRTDRITIKDDHNKVFRSVPQWKVKRLRKCHKWKANSMMEIRHKTDAAYHKQEAQRLEAELLKNSEKVEEIPIQPRNNNVGTENKQEGVEDIPIEKQDENVTMMKEDNSLKEGFKIDPFGFGVFSIISVLVSLISWFFFI